MNLKFTAPNGQHGHNTYFTYYYQKRTWLVCFFCCCLFDTPGKNPFSGVLFQCHDIDSLEYSKVWFTLSVCPSVLYGYFLFCMFQLQFITWFMIIAYFDIWILQFLVVDVLTLCRSTARPKSKIHNLRVPPTIKPCLFPCISSFGHLKRWRTGSCNRVNVITTHLYECFGPVLSF